MSLILFNDYLFVTLKQTFIYNIYNIYYMVKIIYLEKDTHKQVKIAAMVKGITMKQYVTQLIEKDDTKYLLPKNT